jgi:hypothetical protein
MMRLLHHGGDLLPIMASSTMTMVCGGVAGGVTMAVWESGCSLLFLYGEICGGGIVVDVDGGRWWARLVGFLVFYSSSKLFAAAK